MKMHIILRSAAVAILLSSAVAAPHLPGLADAAWAKEGNGNGGGNGGGNGNGNGGGSGGNGNSGQGGSHRSEARSEHGPDVKGGKPAKTGSHHADAAKQKKTVNASLSPSELKGFNSLNRNYRAYLNTRDPRMAAISAYAKAYARYEIDMGTDPAATDPDLGDEALRDALADFTGKPVSDRMLEHAKDVLGVGPEEGKIDQIRDELARR